jgi:hypothetical protein
MQGLDTRKQSFAPNTHEKMRRSFDEGLSAEDSRWEACIRREFATRINDRVFANCRTGEFTNFFGARRQYLGKNKRTIAVEGTKPQYLLKDVDSGQLMIEASTSGYPTDL